MEDKQTKYIDFLPRLMNIRVAVNVKMVATNEIDSIVRQNKVDMFLEKGSKNTPKY